LDNGQALRTGLPSPYAGLRSAEIGDRLAVDVFVSREAAFEALEDAVRDEPGWAGTLFVAPIELDERDVSTN
jgi:hypothetical protein